MTDVLPSKRFNEYLMRHGDEHFCDLKTIDTLIPLTNACHTKTNDSKRTFQIRLKSTSFERNEYFKVRFFSMALVASALISPAFFGSVSTMKCRSNIWMPLLGRSFMKTFYVCNSDHLSRYLDCSGRIEINLYSLVQYANLRIYFHRIYACHCTFET